MKPICMARRLLLKNALLASPGLLAPQASLAQSTYPNKPVRLIVPFPPGGTSDITARILGEALAKALGQPVVIENRAGAGGSLGARYVAEALPDGYTLLLGTTSTHGTNSAVHKHLPFDAVTSFTPVTRIITVPGVLAVNPRFAAKNHADFLKLVRGAPGRFTYASSGHGGATHMAMERYKSFSGLHIVHIPYRGTGPALSDVIAGQVDMIYDTLASSMPHIQAGKLIPIAIASPQRAKELPAVPTLAELGFAQANEGFWNGVLAPAGLPSDVLQTLHAAIVRALQTDTVRSKYQAAGALVVHDTPAAFRQIVAEDVAKWKALATARGIALDG